MNDQQFKISDFVKSNQPLKMASFFNNRKRKSGSLYFENESSRIVISFQMYPKCMNIKVVEMTDFYEEKSTWKTELDCNHFSIEGLRASKKQLETFIKMMATLQMDRRNSNGIQNYYYAN